MDSIEDLKDCLIERGRYLYENETKIRKHINQFGIGRFSDLVDEKKLMNCLFAEFRDYLDKYSLEVLLSDIQQNYSDDLFMCITEEEKISYWKKQLKIQYEKLSKNRYYYDINLGGFFDWYGDYAFVAHFTSDFINCNLEQTQSWCNKRFYERTKEDLEKIRKFSFPSHTLEYVNDLVNPIEKHQSNETEEFKFECYFLWELVEIRQCISQVIEICYIKTQLENEKRPSTESTSQNIDFKFDMDYKTLQNHFEKKYQAFTDNYDHKNHFPNLNSIYVESKNFQEKVYGVYVNDITWDLSRMTRQIGKDLKTEFGFHLSLESRKKEYENHLSKLKKRFLENPYSDIFTLDDFHNEVFEDEKFDLLYRRLIFRKIKQLKSKFLLNYEHNQRKKSEEIDDILFDEYELVFEALFIHIELKILKDNFSKNSKAPKEVKLLEIPENKYPFVFKSNWSCALFIECMKTYVESGNTISKTLLSKYYEFFKNRGYFLNNLKLKNYFKFVNKEYEIRMKRIEPYTSKDKSEKEEMKNIEDEFKKKYTLESLI